MSLVNYDNLFALLNKHFKMMIIFMPLILNAEYFICSG